MEKAYAIETLGLSETIVDRQWSTLGTVDGLETKSYPELVELKGKLHDNFSLFPGFLDVAIEIAKRDKGL